MKNLVQTSLRRLVTVAVIAAVTASTAHSQAGGIAVGETAPDARVILLDGTPTNVSKFYGDKPVVLEFWATWCPLCRALEPAMEAAREKYAGRVDFVGVGVSSNQTAMRQKDYVEKQQLGGSYVFDDAGAAVKAFMVPHTSYIVIVDRHRRIVYTGVGEKQDVDAAIAKAIEMME